MNRYDAVIVGAGPAGLRCGTLLAENGARVLVLERKPESGVKVCAGGITWSGLLERIPENLIERSFTSQHVSTPHQNIRIDSNHPIIATVNRKVLGCYMHEAAEKAGAEVVNSASVIQIDPISVKYLHRGIEKKCHYNFLVGADGSFSKVRRFLGVSTENSSPGITYNCPGYFESMEWHFDADRFGSGYAWIFPHHDTASIGAYCYGNQVRVSDLNRHLQTWAGKKDIILKPSEVRAEKINSDYRGFRFDRIFLVGDAAGLASPLTGEGIYPAFVSGEAAANAIIEPGHEAGDLKRLIQKHRRHELMAGIAARHRFFSRILAETAVFLLRNRIVSFNTFEMA